MSGDLLFAVEIGPVQELIAAARKTRDLWFGSHVVSEVAKAAARCLQEFCGDAGGLVFPAPKNPVDLSPYPASDVNVADVLLAEVPAAAVAQAGGAEQLAASLEVAVRSRWHDFAAEALNRAGQFINKQAWNTQVDDVMECYSAWVSVGSDYAAARAHVMALLGGCTRCRDFSASTPGSYPFPPKSSLDGARDSVLKPVTERNVTHQASLLRLTDGEQLDAVGVTKRMAGRSEGNTSFPSVSRIAADPWLRGVAATASAAELFADFKSKCDVLADAQVLTRIDVGRFEHYQNFPFEGSAVFRTRYRDLAEEAALLSDGQNGLPRQLQELGAALGRLIKQFGEPNPYLAVLVADGDRMTEALNNISSPAQHRQFSQQLAEFAVEARNIVNDHQGALVYAGGDDVLAFLPVDQAVPCGDKLRCAFSAPLKKLLQSWNIGVRPTLSVGIGIGHFLEALEDLLELGRSAEVTAKKSWRRQPERNALCVRLEARGADPLTFRMNWDAKPRERLTEWASLLNDDQLPDKAAFELREMSRIYDNWPDEIVTSALRADARRLLSGKYKADKHKDRGLGKINLLLETVHDAEDLRGLAAEILIGRGISVALQQAEALS